MINEMMLMWTNLIVTNLLLSIICSWSASTSNVEIDDLSSGMICFLFQAPQANWKKSSHGSAAGSMAANRYEEVCTHCGVRQMEEPPTNMNTQQHIVITMMDVSLSN